MPEEIQEQKEIKEYLLGFITLEEARERVEERMMQDEKYYEEMLSVEEDLIQNYIDGDLSREDKKAFERSFLMSDERREQIKFARAFRKYVDEKSSAAPEEKQFVQEPKKNSFWRMFSLPQGFRAPVAVAAGILPIVIISFFVWNAYRRNSEEQQLLALFNKAYKSERTLRSRITEIDYAPFVELRSGDEPKVDKIALALAKTESLRQANENPTAANLHFLARLFLAEKHFDDATQQLLRAQELDPKNAQIFNDLGVVALEKGLARTDDGADSELIMQAHANFDRALNIDPNLLEARFNLARCLEALNLFQEAKEAWKTYLKYDSTSGWATEARDRLQDLESRVTTEMTSDELMQAFLDHARKQQNDAEALGLVSQNRELINLKYLPQKLAMSFLEAPEEEKKTEILNGLKYLGRLEKEGIDDSYAFDLAEFYSRLTPRQVETLRKAQAAVREGYRLCLDKDDFTGAFQQFSEARKLFLEVGNTIEADTIGSHFMAYCLYNNGGRKESYPILMQVDNYTRVNHYEWFSLMNRDWLIGGRASLGYSMLAKTIDGYRESLKKGQSIGDRYMMLKSLRAMLVRTAIAKQDKNTFTYLKQILEISSQPNVSSRQRARGLETVVFSLAKLNFIALSKAVVNESIKLSEAINAPLFVISAQKSAGSIYLNTDDLETAETWLTAAKTTIEKLNENDLQADEKAEIFLRLGELESKKENYQKALDNYNDSLAILDKLNKPLLYYETRKSRLLAYLVTGDERHLEEDIPSVLKLTESYRNELENEEERNSFFNYEQEVYDIAIAHEIKKNNSEQAFNYAEASSSRSLLDSLVKEKDTPVPGIASGEITRPLQLNEIRERMPGNVQIMQYAVLKDKTLIWIISKEKVDTVTLEVNASDLKSKVTAYLSSIQARNPEKREQVETTSRELYRVLVEPALQYLARDREVCIVPNKMLFNLPFASLISSNGKFFLEEFTFFYAPSSNTFVILTDDAAKRNYSQAEKLLVVGNPAFDQQKVSDLKDLPGSRAEAQEIARNYRAPEVLLGKEATKDAFRKALKNSDVIHFAGPYLVNPRVPLLSELVMANSSDRDDDNFFTNAELKNERLPRARLVVLSACQTGVEGYSNGEGLIGLSRTFLSLGVPQVVATQWAVESDPSRDLMKTFHRYRIQEKLSSRKALQKAQLEMARDPNNRYTSPFYWAAFASFGGYTEF